MAELQLEPEPELEVRTERELAEDHTSLFPSDGFELLFDANGGLGSRYSPAANLFFASLSMSSSEHPSSSEPLDCQRSNGLAGRSLDLCSDAFCLDGLSLISFSFPGLRV